MEKRLKKIHLDSWVEHPAGAEGQVRRILQVQVRGGDEIAQEEKCQESIGEAQPRA